MARLPQPGGDDGNWGLILNEYLEQSHKPGGQLKDDTVNAAVIVDGSITETLLDTSVRAKLNSVDTIVDGSVSTPKLADGAVTNVKIASGIDQAKVTGLTSALSNRPIAVIVATGNEPRPTGSIVVIWYGGTVQPINMGTSDIWMTAGTVVTPSDTTAPSVPTGVTASAITSGSCTLSWNASTDNIAVTGYEVRRNGTVSAGTPTNPSLNISGLDASTTYIFDVRAHDGAGNWSNWSTPAASVTTTAVVAGQYSVFGGAAPPGSYTTYTDGSGLTVASSFYKTTGDSRCIGAKVWIPNGQVWDNTNVPITMNVYKTPVAATTPNWSGDFITSAQISSVTLSAWNEVMFEEPISFNPVDNETPERIWIGYSDASMTRYVHSPSPTPSSIGSGTLPSLQFSAQGNRSANTSTEFEVNSMYGIDIIVDEG